MRAPAPFAPPSGHPVGGLDAVLVEAVAQVRPGEEGAARAVESVQARLSLQGAEAVGGMSERHLLMTCAGLDGALGVYGDAVVGAVPDGLQAVEVVGQGQVGSLSATIVCHVVPRGTRRLSLGQERSLRVQHSAVLGVGEAAQRIAPLRTRHR